jgi:formylglycine-generating enzyme required for sulfatase activity
VLSVGLFVLLVLLAGGALAYTLGVRPADVRTLLTGWLGPGTPKPPQPYENSLGMKFVWVEPGAFTMGSPVEPPELGRFADEAPHRVTVTRGFYVSASPVTQKQWRVLMKDDPSHFKGDDLPVESVSWDDCQEFVKRLRASDGLAYRLPSEAEWEYACRAGTSTPYSFGDSAAKLGEQAWFLGNAGDRTHPVGTRGANAWGLCDVHGNVRHWCEDLYGPYEGLPEVDPLRSERHGDDLRVVRNGSWRSDAADCRSAYRYRLPPGYRDANLGCRVLFRPE